MDLPDSPYRSAGEALRAVALPDICRIEHLASHTGLPEQLILDALASGEIPGRRLGGHWLISRASVLEWLRGSDAGRAL